MKSIPQKCLAGLMAFAAMAVPMQMAAQDQPGLHQKQTHYTLTILGSLGGTNCCLAIAT